MKNKRHIGCFIDSDLHHKLVCIVANKRTKISTILREFVKDYIEKNKIVVS